MRSTAKYLVVEDEELIADGLTKYLGRVGEAHAAATVAAARALLETDRDWTGIVLDVGLPDGTGLELLAWIRAEGLDVPVMVLTGNREEEVVRAAALHGATYLPKPFGREHLAAFVAYSRRASDGSAILQRVVATLGYAWRLSPREREIVLLGASGLDRAGIAEALDISPHTLNTYVRRVLVKARADSWQALVSEIHANIFAAARDARSD